MPDTIYKNRIGILAQVRETFTFAGQVRVVTLMVNPLQRTAEVKVRDADSFTGWDRGTLADWDAAVEDVILAKRELDERVQSAIDAEEFGIEVAVSGRWSSSCNSVYIVRTTKTTFVDEGGTRWSRKTKRKVGEPYSIGAIYLSSGSVYNVERFIGDRPRVDIVKERKASKSAQTSEGAVQV